jgi:glycosyltransferase involved in cell wall biosynthesis
MNVVLGSDDVGHPQVPAAGGPDGAAATVPRQAPPWSPAAADAAGDTRSRPLPLVDVVIPVYNEEQALPGSVRALHGYLTQNFPFDWRITIADNGSTDATLTVAQGLANGMSRVSVVHLDAKGRGLALRSVWSGSDADVVAYMDVDLSTGLDAFLPLVAPLLSGHSDLAIGSRLRRGARVVRGPKREFISRSYNLLLRLTFRSSFRDAQCGFKAVRADVVRALLPAVENNRWFFDTEMLLLADRNGLRIHEVPVDWTDDLDSRVNVTATAMEDLRGMWRVARRIMAGRAGIDMPPALRAARLPVGMRRQLPRFAAIGVVSTIAYILLYALLREGMSSFAANFFALAITMVGNTWANRRFTFQHTGSERAVRHFAESGVVFVVGLAVSSAALALLDGVVGSTGTAVELLILLASGVLATAVRFVLMRAWVFHPSRSPRS